MSKFRKKPVVIEAVRFDGANHDEIIAFMSGNVIPGGASGFLAIQTLEGRMTVSPGDWVIQEPFPTADRTFYPCKPDIFEKTYEEVTDD